MSCCADCKKSNSNCNKKVAKNQILISRALLKQRNLETILKFAYFADPLEFIQRFKEVGIIVTGKPENILKELEILAWLGNSGADRAGKMRDDVKKTPIHFSVLETVSRVNISEQELENSGIKIIP